MSFKSYTEEVAGKVGIETLVTAAPILSHSKLLRHAFLNAGQNYIQNIRPKRPRLPRPVGVEEDLAEYSKVIWETADRILDHNLAKPVLRSALNNLVNGIMIDGGTQSAMLQFNKKYGINPPGFLTLSPGKACNLQCTGCYANAGADAEKLDWGTFDRIITEAKTLWGVRFLVISGGEPLAYRSEGKGILEAAEKHPDVFFLMYTNGTLITDSVAKRMAELGNITPAISVEGWRERTDERRGTGIYDKVLEAMARLRKAGVPYGISLTATRYNAEELFSDEFMDYFFEEQGALYAWIFHYMPIGRSFTLDLMPTPDQRLWMYKRLWQLIHEKHYFLADFWNHATLSEGCLAAGRFDGGGYIYIDWNGAVSPCVFVPYASADIRSIYANGGTLNDVWSTPFFAGIRNWQGKYRDSEGNWLAPCIIRDHHAELRHLIAQNEPEPTDENAQKALLDPDYATGLEAYDEAYASLTDPIWQKYYLNSQNKGKIHDRPSPERRVNQ